MPVSNAQSSPAVREVNAPRNQAASRLQEAPVWRAAGQGWRQLYGGFYESGLSIEWHDFEPRQRFEWSRSFHSQSLELCLNIAGDAELACDGAVLKLGPLSTAFYLPGTQSLTAWREAGVRHRFITVEFSALFLQERLNRCDGALDPAVENFIRGREIPSRLGELHRLSAAQEKLVTQLLNPPVAQGARALWYEGKVLEIMAEFLFGRPGNDELFCDRQKRLARERVERVMALLEKNLVEPLSLEELGRKVGCSSFHLSRTFSAETGTTIPQYLRRLRIEHAAALLRTGKFNVTEAAMAVGYSSLSHFSQAFCQTMGCCPGLYPLKGTPGRQSST